MEIVEYFMVRVIENLTTQQEAVIYTGILGAFLMALVSAMVTRPILVALLNDPAKVKRYEYPTFFFVNFLLLFLTSALAGLNYIYDHQVNFIYSVIIAALSSFIYYYMPVILKKIGKIRIKMNGHSKKENGNG